MIRKNYSLLFIILILIFSFSSFADIDTGVACSDTGGEPPEYDCQILSDNGDNYYCDVSSGYCFLEELETISESEIVETNRSIEILDSDIDKLQNDLDEINSQIDSLNDDISSIRIKLSLIDSDVKALQSEFSSVENQQSSFSVGLAGLQQNLDDTKTSLEEVEGSLNKRKAFIRFLTITVFILLITGIAAAIISFTNNKKTTPDIIHYITSHIKKGSKYHHIKNNLLQAGWSDEDVKKAYKDTAKHNYKKFKGPVKKSSKPGPGVAYDHKKMISITIVSVLLIVGFLFVLRGVSTGQAISFQKLIGGEVGGTSGKVTYDLECTPPHILTPNGDACCLDEDQSGVCDNTEARNLTQTKGECIDNAQCGFENYCINSQCTSLSSLYEGKGDCSKLCNYYALNVLTSDGEKYNLKPKKGSYTSAGALEWKILEMPDHCKGEQAIIPVNIIKKKTGQILNEHVITLRQGQTSQVQTHPEISNLAFTLKVDEIFELCSE